MQLNVNRLTRRGFIAAAALGTASLAMPALAAPSAKRDASKDSSRDGGSSTSFVRDAGKGMREVTDLAGNTITVPEMIESVIITSWKGALETFVVLQSVDLIKGMCDTMRYSWLRQVFPGLSSLTDYGNFDNVNLEALVEAKPDIIFAPEAATKAIPQMQQLGLPVYVDGIASKGDPYEGRDAELTAVADLLGQADKAQAYLAWEKKWLDEVARRVADVPDTDRKTALCMRTDVTEVFNDVNILGKTVENAGGVNVAKDAFSGKFFGTVSAEDIVQWNPDFIFQYTISGSQASLLGRYDDMKADNRFSGLKALQNGDFYVMPVGINNWGGKMESALGALTMGKVVYPERFADVVIKDVAEDFYRQFMGRELSADDWATIAQNATDAKELPLE